MAALNSCSRLVKNSIEVISRDDKGRRSPFLPGVDGKLACCRATTTAYGEIAMENMKSKVVVITGATSGIGQVAAEKLAAMGARIVR